jgi:GNAT superfamily N-acetyltransferase
MVTPWVKFMWVLSSSPLAADEGLPPFSLRRADREDEPVVQKVVLSSFSLDSGFGDSAKRLSGQLAKEISHVFQSDRAACLVLQHGQRIIAASALNFEPDAENHLPTGPCVLHEYRSRGIGSYLLRRSLATLREEGLERAFGVVRTNTIAARFVYPKCGGILIEPSEESDRSQVAA